MADESNGSAEPTEARRVPPEELAKLLEQGGISLLDVRESYEWDAGRIAGAEHVAIAELPARAEELGREEPLVVYCRGGRRSAFAADALRSAGFDASSLGGGISAWVEAGQGLEPEGGYVAESGRAAAALQARRRTIT